MKVLWIHWRLSSIDKDWWQKRIEIFDREWLELELFQFDQSEDPTYESWKATFETIDFSKYDAVYTSSLWGAMTTKYILEKSISLLKMVICVPWVSHLTIDWNHPNLKSLYDSLSSISLTHLVKKMYVLHPRDDEITPYINGKAFAEDIWAELITLETWGHLLKWHIDLIIGKLKE